MNRTEYFDADKVEDLSVRALRIMKELEIPLSKRLKSRLSINTVFGLGFTGFKGFSTCSVCRESILERNHKECNKVEGFSIVSPTHKGLVGQILASITVPGKLSKDEQAFWYVNVPHSFGGSFEKGGTFELGSLLHTTDISDEALKDMLQTSMTWLCRQLEAAY